MEIDYGAIRLGLILAIQADIEAMKVHNLQLEPEQIPEQGYNSDQFFQKAEELRNTSHAHINQLLGI